MIIQDIMQKLLFSDDHSRVILEGPNDYINANFIEVVSNNNIRRRMSMLFRITFFNYFVWLGITDEGFVPEIRIWSILLLN